MHKKLMRNSVDMLNGPLLKNMLLFYFPLVLSSVLQALFNTADIAIVGRFCGSICVAAVGSTSSLVNLFLNLFIGLSTGASVCVAHAIGSKSERDTENAVHTAMCISIISGILVSVLGFFFSSEMLKLMGTPNDILALSTKYLKIYFCGTLFNSIYNFGAAIFRSSGDTFKPLVILTAAGVLNVILNILFVTIFKMDVDGVALATIISQFVSAVVIVIALMRKNDSCRLYLKKLKIHARSLKKVISLGLPSAFQSMLFSIANVSLQSSINSFGSTVVSGASAAISIENFVYLFMNGFYHVTLNFAGQNMGAKNIKRIKKITVTALLCTLTIGLSTGLLARLFGKTLLGIFISDSPSAILCGLERMDIVSTTYFLCGIMEVLVGSVRAMGLSIEPMIISLFGSCFLRLAWVFTVFKLPLFHTIKGLYIVYPISWIVTSIALFILYKITYKKKEKLLA